MDIDISTSEKEAEIYIYVNQKNCTINKTSDNFSQKCFSQLWKI